MTDAQILASEMVTAGSNVRKSWRPGVVSSDELACDRLPSTPNGTLPRHRSGI